MFRQPDHSVVKEISGFSSALIVPRLVHLVLPTKRIVAYMSLVGFREARRLPSTRQQRIRPSNQTSDCRHVPVLASTHRLHVRAPRFFFAVLSRKMLGKESILFGTTTKQRQAAPIFHGYGQAGINE
jgi:hypothetical protein